MRHQKNTIKLGRNAASRKALMRNLADDFVVHGKIKTTKAKALALRSVVEKYITLAKVDSLHCRRQLLKYFFTEQAVNKLIKELGPKYKERNGGYTRIIKIEPRQGDRAEMAIMELV